MKEEWKDIKDYEGLYQVSSTGRIRSLDRYVVTRDGKTKHIKGIIKNTRPDSRAMYMLVDLSKEGISKTCLVHRLVAEAFISNNYNLPQVNHKDENKQNNNVSNLEWCDQIYNSNYGTVAERIKHSNADSYERMSKPVICMNDMRVYKSTVEAGKNYNVDYANISRICNGIRKHSKGYVFAYVD